MKPFEENIVLIFQNFPPILINYGLFISNTGLKFQYTIFQHVLVRKFHWYFGERNPSNSLQTLFYGLLKILQVLYIQTSLQAVTYYIVVEFSNLEAARAVGKLLANLSK